MPEVFSESWEYHQPNPDLVDALADDQRCDGFDRFGIDQMRYADRGWNVGIRFGRGNPNGGRFWRAKPKRGREYDERPARNCPTCDTLFAPKYRSQVYCSRRCVPAVKVLTERVCCVVCGGRFWPDRSNRVACSKRCGNTLAARGRVRSRTDLVDRAALVALLARGMTVTAAARVMGHPSHGPLCRAVKGLGLAGRPGAKSKLDATRSAVAAAYLDLRPKETELAAILAVAKTPLTRDDWLPQAGLDPRPGRGRTDSGKRCYVNELEKAGLVTRQKRCQQGVADGGRIADLYSPTPQLLALMRPMKTGNSSTKSTESTS